MANAQVISFNEEAAKGSLNGKTFGTDGFVLTVNDPKGEKVQIDANSQYFGTADKYTSYAYRMKTNGKSSSSNSLSLTIPSDGTLNVCVRTASSSDATRNVIFQQDGTEILNQTLNDADAVKATIEGEEKNVFPIYSCPVKAGTVDITYPVNAVNFYAFELVSGSDNFEASITSDPENSYFSGYQSFDMQKVISALGLADEAALQTLISAGGNVYIKTAEGLSNSYTGNSNEFWMNAEGAAQGYSADGTCWYAGLYYDEAGTDAETGEAYESDFYCKVGQMPKYFASVYTDSELKVVLVLKNGDKEVEFAITLNVNAAKMPAEIADPVNKLTDVKVVKEYETTLNFTYGKEYENNKISVDMSDIATALGCSADAIADNIQKITLTEKMSSVTSEETSETTNTPSGELDTPANLAGGSWFGRYSNYDEATGETTTFTQNYSHAWGANATFYVQEIAFADGVFTFNTGQYMKTMEAGAQDYATLYILNGATAAKLTIKVNVTEPETIDPSAMVKVGESTVEVSAAIDDSYATKAFTVDMEAICAALGCTASDIADVLAYAQDGSISDNHTESSGGYYFNEDGMIEGWGSNAAFFVAKTSLSNGQYTVGQMSGHYTTITEDKTCTAKLVFQYGQNYYIVNVVYTVKAPTTPEEPVEYEQVATDMINMQIIPNNEDVCAWETTASIDLEYVKGLIGTEDFTLYTDKASTAEDGTVTLEWSKKYTCTPAPGFWYGTTEYTNSEGQVIVDNAGWGTNSFGITYASGAITYYQYPGQRSVGDSYQSYIYLVNEENGKYITICLHVSYVDEVTPETEVVGTESILVKASEDIADADGYYVYTPDLSKTYEALGLTAADLESAQIVAPKSQYVYGNYEAEEQILYGPNGYVAANEEDAVYAAFLTIADGTPVIKIDDMEGALEATDAAKIVVRIGLEYDGKRYMHEIILANEAAYTSVNNVKTAATASTIYTIAGAKVNSLQKGINIVKMTDGQVKKVYVK